MDEMEKTELIERIKSLGYEFDHYFPGEYMLFFRRKDFACIRLYDNGRIKFKRQNRDEEVILCPEKKT